jgi:hypothetical protein
MIVYDEPDRGFVVLDYRTPERDHSERIELVTTCCNYGGVRWWSLCPKCSRRVAVLWGAPWLCRKCHGLAYRSSQRSKADRPVARARALQAKFGEDADSFGGAFDPPLKPKGMHSRTYDRLCEQLEDADDRSWAELRSCAWVRRVLASGSSR